MRPLSDEEGESPIVRVRVPLKQRTVLTKLAKKDDITLSELIRKIIDGYINIHDDLVKSGYAPEVKVRMPVDLWVKLLTRAKKVSLSTSDLALGIIGKFLKDASPESGEPT